MGDEIDPCECLWSHELTMRRLVALLRASQTYCTDAECLDEPSRATPTDPSGSFLTMFLMMALAVAMYAMRPRRQVVDADKPTPDNYQDRDGAPPTPPRI